MEGNTNCILNTKIIGIVIEKYIILVLETHKVIAYHLSLASGQDKPGLLSYKRRRTIYLGSGTFFIFIAHVPTTHDYLNYDKP